MIDWLAQVLQAVTPPFLIVCVVVVTVLLLVRTLRNIQISRKTVPLLQWRDLVTFVYFAVIVTGQQYSRLTGFALGQQQWWVVLTDLLAITVGGLWLFIEIGVIGRNQTDVS